MSADFDPYEQWLDIPREEQPADHYRLLGLARFETDRGRIAAAADERMTQVRTFQTGPRGAYTQKLLNELAAARVTLLDSASKAAYDGQLAARLSQLEAARRARAPRPVVEAPAAPRVPPQERPRASVNPQARRRLNGHRPLLIGACVVAIGLAAGGWVLSRHKLPNGEATKASVPPAKSPKSQAAEQPVVAADSSGGYECLPREAKLSGDLEVMATAEGDMLGPWNAVGDAAVWNLRVARPGFFQAQVTYAGTAAAEESELEIRIGSRARRLSLRGTGGLERFETDSLTIAIERSGSQTLAIRTPAPQRGAWLRVRSVRLLPIGANPTP